MGLFDGLVSGLAGGLFNLASTSLTNQANASQSSLNRNFQSEQAQLNRDFSAEQAQINRDFEHAETIDARQFQTDFYKTYQSPQAMARQYAAAGINPSLVAGGTTPSPVSASAPSGSAASAPGTPPGSTAHFISPDASAIIDFARGINDIKNSQALTNADVKLKEAQANESNQNVVESESRIALNEAQTRLVDANTDSTLEGIGLIRANISSVQIQTALNEAKISTEEAQQALLEYETLIKETESKYRDSILRAQRNAIEASTTLDHYRSLREQADTRLADARVHESVAEVEKISSEIERIDVDIQQAEKDLDYSVKTFDTRVQKATEDLRKSKGDADYSNGVGKRYTVDKVFEGTEMAVDVASGVLDVLLFKGLGRAPAVAKAASASKAARATKVASRPKSTK